MISLVLVALSTVAASSALLCVNKNVAIGYAIVGFVLFLAGLAGIAVSTVDALFSPKRDERPEEPSFERKKELCLLCDGRFSEANPDFGGGVCRICRSKSNQI